MRKGKASPDHINVTTNRTKLLLGVGRDGSASIRKPTLADAIPHLLAGKRLSKQSTRIESRLAGADADPTLSVLVTLAAFHEAIANNVKGNGADREVTPYDDIMPVFKLPKSVDEAQETFLESDYAKRLLGDKLYLAIAQEMRSDKQPERLARR